MMHMLCDLHTVFRMLAFVVHSWLLLLCQPLLTGRESLRHGVMSMWLYIMAGTLHYFMCWIFFSFFSAYSRKLIHEYDLYYRDSSGKIISDAYKFNVIVTTYEVMLCKHHSTHTQ